MNPRDSVRLRIRLNNLASAADQQLKYNKIKMEVAAERRLKLVTVIFLLISISELIISAWFADMLLLPEAKVVCSSSVRICSLAFVFIVNTSFDLDVKENLYCTGTFVLLLHLLKLTLLLASNKCSQQSIYFLSELALTCLIWFKSAIGDQKRLLSKFMNDQFIEKLGFSLKIEILALIFFEINLISPGAFLVSFLFWDLGLNPTRNLYYLDEVNQKKVFRCPVCSKYRLKLEVFKCQLKFYETLVDVCTLTSTNKATHQRRNSISFQRGGQYPRNNQPNDINTLAVNASRGFLAEKLTSSLKSIFIDFSKLKEFKEMEVELQSWIKYYDIHNESISMNNQNQKVSNTSLLDSLSLRASQLSSGFSEFKGKDAKYNLGIFYNHENQKSTDLSYLI